MGCLLVLHMLCCAAPFCWDVQTLNKLVKLITSDTNARAPLQWRHWTDSYMYWPSAEDGSGPGEYVYAASAQLQEDAFSAAAQILQASTSAGVTLTDRQHARKRLPKLLAAVPQLPVPDSDSSGSDSDSSDDAGGDVDDPAFADVVRPHVHDSDGGSESSGGGWGPWGEVCSDDEDYAQGIEALLQDDIQVEEVGYDNQRVLATVI
jgi:hypothetical protein